MQSMISRHFRYCLELTGLRVGKGNVRSRSSPDLFVNDNPRLSSETPTLCYHSSVIVEKYPSVRSTSANPYPLTLMNLIRPI